MLIKRVYVIFIANGIDCLGGICDNCCDCLNCFKDKDENEKIEEYEEIKEDEDFIKDEKITAKSLVNDNWLKAKEKNLVLKIFKKKGDEVFPSKDNGNKISIKLDEKGNPKIVYQNLGGKKYAFFEIKTKDEKTVYLYCGDVESSTSKKGIFEEKPHRDISVIASAIENIKDMISDIHR